MGKPLVFGHRGSSALLHNIPIHGASGKLSGNLQR